MSRLFWGLIFSVINISISGFRLPMDILGYILIYKGLDEMEYESEVFFKGKPWALLLVLWSIISVFIRNMDENVLSAAMKIAAMASQIYILYVIPLGVSDLDADEGEKLMKAFRVFAVIQILCFFADFFSLESFGLFAAAANILSMAYYLFRLWHAADFFKPRQ